MDSFTPIQDHLPPKSKAAAYVRMSTNSQRYSIDNQLHGLMRYAALHSMEIVEVYADSGKSGLSIKNRAGLTRLIDDVQSREVAFSTLLILDVSRWGRFQDTDESAHYEFLCRSNGVQVIYCAEPFENDLGALATLVKGMKRAMAAEYSRDLAAKCIVAHKRLAAMGFHQGGPPGYGLRRLMINADGEPITLMETQERKAIHTARTVLVRGPKAEVAAIQRIFRMFVDEQMGYSKITHRLNAEGGRPTVDRLWYETEIRLILMNERYVGRYVWNRVSNPLRAGKIQNPPEQWIRADGAVEPITDETTFARAQARIATYPKPHTKAGLLSKLRTYADKHGRLSARLMDTEKALPCSQIVKNHFGSLREAYALIGYEPPKTYGHLGDRGRALACRTTVVEQLTERLLASGCRVKFLRRTNVLRINDISILVRVASQKWHTQVGDRWCFLLKPPVTCELVLFIRMDGSSADALDYFLFPVGDIPGKKYWSRRTNPPPIDRYRLRDFQPIYDLAAQRPVGILSMESGLQH
jgi:DNA invertase Pin-like site-specific DNA recombinase